MVDSVQAVTELGAERSWAVLTGSRVGRLVTCVDQHCEIFPINFVADGEALVFRTAEGSKLFSMTINSRVLFEVDGWDSTGGWSVIARGNATEVVGDDVERLEKLGLRPWIPTVKTHWMRFIPDELSGRQFAFGPEPERDPAAAAAD